VERLVIGISQYPTSFHPSFESHLARSYINGMTRRPVTSYDADWTLICMLCVELPDLAKGTARDVITPSGKEGRAITYTLDPQARWGDGTPMTTRDVMFTWEIGRNEATGVTNFELFRRIEAVEIVDEKTFTLITDERTCEYQGINDFEILPSHLEGEVAADPGLYRERTLYDRDTANPGLWNGPYRVKSVQPGSAVVLERNPEWWGKAPAFDEIEVRVIENTAALMANLLAGDIDMISGEIGLTLDQALSFEQRVGDQFRFVYTPGLIYEHIDLNLSNPLLADVRVRRAMLHAIDREAINARLFDGRQPPAHGNVNPLDAVYFEGVPRYAFDPAAARALLDEAGFTPGADGIRTNAAGEKLRFEIMTTAGNKTRELVQQVLQSMVRDVGIELVIRNQPPRVLFGETLNRRQFDAMAMFAWISAPRNIPRTTLHSEMIPSEANSWGGQNYTGYANPRMDEILEALKFACEPEENQALWNELQTLYATELPALPLYFRANADVLPPWLEGVRPTGHMESSTLWVESWTRRP
jgi:peptide/nickel transport system substrate-binding protein